MVVAAVFVHSVSLLCGETVAQVEWTVQALVALLAVGVLATAVLYRVHFELLSEIGATRTNLAYYAHPVSTAVAGSLLLGEQVTITTIIGLVIIFAGFVFIEWERFWTSVSNIRQGQI